ncbi:tRNA (N(6)-L-threonylcarbamoyladenosine(37)-C(2))-methylthiotransferase MtaB [Thiohalorhabdus methylotrophus]|uniref:tRNA (N(6)-L-threonylcarbamoyladenosine(37)-C(2))-methylthiotransferase MtaB n=1 Tax=Thiohalorhabdus methylotrophus TaxID=3242694 RepID=A0ABV4TU45_9GAMM
MSGETAPLSFVDPHAGEEAGSKAAAGVRRVATTTMGCKVNQFETEAIRQALRGAEYELVPFEAEADLYLVNTCTVTSEADRQARQLVRRALRRNPEAFMVVAGCYAQRDPEAVAAIPGVDLVLGNGEKVDVHGLIPDLEAGELPQVMVGDPDEASAVPEGLLTRFESRTRGFLQVQQGCDQSCTFCIISSVRGGNRSVPVRHVVRQVDRWAQVGTREFVVTGVDVGSYGADLEGGADLAGLLAAVAEREGDFRLRLSSLDPSHITDELIGLFREEPKLCPHVHLSLQHGDAKVLKQMKRRYGPSLVRERMAALREAAPDLVLSADVLVGFPTETEAAFEAALALVDELEIAYPHVFPFSPRPETPGGRIPEKKQVPPQERKARAARMRELGAQIRQRVLERAAGKPQRVLVEEPDRHHPGWMRGRAATYLPVRIPEGWVEPGEFVECVPEQVEEETLVARR